MTLADLIPDPEALIALEPEELGLRMLPVLARWPQQQQLHLTELVHMVCGHPQAQPGSLYAAGLYPQQYKSAIEVALREAWAWLEGAALLVQHPRYVDTIKILSRRAVKLAQEPEKSRVSGARRVPKDALHPKIREDVWSLYHRGKYDTAVFEAMKAVEVAVREAAGFSDADYGTDMIGRAFNEDKGQLRDPTAPAAERIALRNLFVGAHGSYKNPHSHRNVALNDPDEAADIIMLANHLLRIVDSRKAANP